MNCKPGQLARIVKSDRPENINAIVRVDYPAMDIDDGVPGEYYWSVTGLQPISGIEVTVIRNCVIRRREKTMRPGLPLVCMDSCLRPLYDGDGVDEMLRITGKPLVLENLNV